MGTDVHAIWQARKDGKWADVESTWDQDRHYLLFSWLANVRNGFGFAGVPTYDPIVPIAMPRGLPADFEDGEDHVCAKECLAPRRQQWADSDDVTVDGRYRVYMGDHTFSWLTADEILSAKRPATIQRTGVVPIEFYRSWDGKSPPESWSGSISGKDIWVALHPRKIRSNTTHVQIEWDAPDELDYFVDEVRRLKALHGDVRIVFGFDS